MELLDPDICYEALRTRDERFDGRLFVGVKSTGIYCRPVCPARTAMRANCSFFLSAAAAQEAGFRPCLRCRPETAPDGGSWRGTSNTAARGLALIAEGELDGASVDAFAERLGIGARQLRRLFMQHLGASPIAVAQTRRVLFAKQLIHETRLPMAEIAFAAGFGSVRRFNETFQRLFHRPPSALRRKAVVALPEGTVASGGVTVRLRYRPPYDWTAMLAYLSMRAVDGLEEVKGGVYRRVLRQDGQIGTVEIAHVPEQRTLAATIRIPDVRALVPIVARIRRVFDLGADVTAIGAHLSRDPLLAPLVRARPGLRVPGGWDGFELAMRAILGQQISVEGARQLTGRLTRLSGPAVSFDSRDDAALAFAFPTPAEVAGADLTTLGMPGARRQALVAVAEAAMADPLLFQPLETVEDTVAKLRAVRGLGDWTAHYIALRAAHEPDAFPASDVGLLRSMGRLTGTRPSPSDLLARAERWRPWRAYGAQHLWTAEASARDAVPRRSHPPAALSSSPNAAP
jgi:AraC family transcriptional regulator of adaptative response / DNA-3-methyladenine glycosylase II